MGMTKGPVETPEPVESGSSASGQKGLKGPVAATGDGVGNGESAFRPHDCAAPHRSLHGEVSAPGHHHGHDHGPGAHDHAPEHEKHPRFGVAKVADKESGQDQRRLGWALLVTGTIFFAELIGGFYSGSLALLSDAGHMLTDGSALLIALLAARIAERPADTRRTYGYYRFEILAALLNGAILIALAGYIGYEAFERIAVPEPVKTKAMIAVACVGLVANLVGMRILHGRTGNLNVRGAYLHLLSDTLSSVAVVLGGVVMWTYDGLWFIDPILSVLISILILLSGYRLIRESVSILLEAVPAGLDTSEIAASMAAVDGVAHVHDLHVWSITSGMYALSAHVVLAPGFDSVDNNDVLGDIRELLCAQFKIDHTTIQIESEGYEHLGAAHRD